MTAQMSAAQAAQQLRRSRTGQYTEGPRQDPGQTLLRPDQDLCEQAATRHGYDAADPEWAELWQQASQAADGIFDQTGNLDDPQSGVDAGYRWARDCEQWTGIELKVITELVARRHFPHPEQAAAAAALAAYSPVEANNCAATPVYPITQARQGRITHIGRGVMVRRCDCGEPFFTNGYILYSKDEAQHRMRAHQSQSDAILPEVG